MSNYYKGTLVDVVKIFHLIKNTHKTVNLQLQVGDNILTINNIDVTISLVKSKYDSVRITKALEDIHDTLFNGMDANGLVVNNVDIFIEHFDKFITLYCKQEQLITDADVQNKLREVVTEIVVS